MKTPSAPSIWLRALSGRLRAFLLAIAVLCGGAVPALAHRPFEVTGDARLQHGRLEFGVTISLIMANYLLRDSLDGPVTLENFSAHREALLKLAPGFYAVSDGKSPLKPEKIDVQLNKSLEPEFYFVFPQPAGQQLVIKAAGLGAPGPEGRQHIRVFDDNETLLGEGYFGGPADVDELRIPLSTTP